MVQSIEDYSLQNISNRINLRRIQTSTLHIRFPVFLRWRAMHHVSMYFLRKTVFHFLPRDKDHVFGKKYPIFLDNTTKIMCRCGPFWKDHLFKKFEEKIIFQLNFFGKTISLGRLEKENMVFRAVFHVPFNYKELHRLDAFLIWRWFKKFFFLEKEFISQ